MRAILLRGIIAPRSGAARRGPRRLRSRGGRPPRPCPPAAESTSLYGLSYNLPYDPPHNRRILDKQEGKESRLRTMAMPTASSRAARSERISASQTRAPRSRSGPAAGSRAARRRPVASKRRTSPHAACVTMASRVSRAFGATALPRPGGPRARSGPSAPGWRPTPAGASGRRGVAPPPRPRPAAGPRPTARAWGERGVEEAQHGLYRLSVYNGTIIMALVPRPAPPAARQAPGA